MKLGTKEVLFKTKSLDWGCDVDVYKTRSDMEKRLPEKLRPNISRVLKQYRGNGGNGVWRIEIARKNRDNSKNPYVKVLHAQRNSKEEVLLLSDFIDRIKEYFEQNGMVIDQEFFSPEPNGMIRCYMSRNKVVGFGHQYVKNLLRPEESNDLDSKPRIYHSKEKAEFQDLREIIEHSWIEQAQ